MGSHHAVNPAPLGTRAQVHMYSRSIHCDRGGACIPFSSKVGHKSCLSCRLDGRTMLGLAGSSNLCWMAPLPLSTSQDHHSCIHIQHQIRVDHRDTGHKTTNDPCLILKVSSVFAFLSSETATTSKATQISARNMDSDFLT
jgi:hypothetical protein